MAGEAVLVVEQEAAVRTFLEEQLTDDGFEVVSAEEGRKALDLLERARPDLVLLDAILPDASGFAVCERLRAGEPGRSWNRDVPVIMVSARSEPVDRLRGFARGCDDYLAKPFLYEELLARMRAVLRRAGHGFRETLTVGDLTVDLASRTVRVGEERVYLSAKEYDLLVALADDPQRVYRKEELLRDVWGFRSTGSKFPTFPMRAGRWCLAESPTGGATVAGGTLRKAGVPPAREPRQGCAAMIMYDGAGTRREKTSPGRRGARAFNLPRFHWNPRRRRPRGRGQAERENV